jgi:DNA replicative helicase MCM subunit Mcm2 (Cdc46/Mcm family)
MRSRLILTRRRVQVRTLETIIRLSSAAAKVRLSGAVEVVDVEVARGLLAHVLQGATAPT